MVTFHSHLYQELMRYYLVSTLILQDGDVFVLNKDKKMCWRPDFSCPLMIINAWYRNISYILGFQGKKTISRNSFFREGTPNNHKDYMFWAKGTGFREIKKIEYF